MQEDGAAEAAGVPAHHWRRTAPAVRLFCAASDGARRWARAGGRESVLQRYGCWQPCRQSIRCSPASRAILRGEHDWCRKEWL